MVKGILTDKEQTFLINYPEGRSLTDSERHYVSSITRKTRQALKDLDLVFKKLPKPYLLFSEEETISLNKPIKEVTTILWYQNYQQEFRKRLRKKVKRQINKQIIYQLTRKQLIQIVDSVLENVKLP